MSAERLFEFCREKTMRRDYRAALRAKGIRPLRGQLRTERKAGDHEIVWDREKREYVGYIHQEAAE